MSIIKVVVVRSQSEIANQARLVLPLGNGCAEEVLRCATRETLTEVLGTADVQHVPESALEISQSARNSLSVFLRLDVPARILSALQCWLIWKWLLRHPDLDELRDHPHPQRYLDTQIACGQWDKWTRSALYENKQTLRITPGRVPQLARKKRVHEEWVFTSAEIDYLEEQLPRIEIFGKPHRYGRERRTDVRKAA